jgi:hypothetical protein
LFNEGDGKIYGVFNVEVLFQTSFQEVLSYNQLEESEMKFWLSGKNSLNILVLSLFVNAQ